MTILIINRFGHYDIMEYTNIYGYLLIYSSIVFVFFCTENVRYKINSFIYNEFKN
jgi:hypothetical protein